MAKFILHVWTKNAEKRQWVVHYMGHTLIVNSVSVLVPTETSTDPHGDLDANGNTCAHWYLVGNGEVAAKDGHAEIYNESLGVEQGTARR